jgi:molecular chaperone DnaK (HSP70)
MALAIDFGTSNTVVARWNAALNQPEVVNLSQLAWRLHPLPPLVPSLVHVDNAALGQVLIGQPVRDRGLDRAQGRFFRNFKRGIGTSVQGFLPEIDGQLVSFEQIGQWFLSALIRDLKAQEGDLDSLIFTVPVDSFEAYRSWLGELCQQLDIEQVRMLDEPTAAALGYGLRGGETLLVIDFGGGTLDFSLVQLAAQTGRQPLGFLLKWGQTNLAEKSGQAVKTAQVLAKAGENLGGSDIDSWLAEYFEQTQGMAVSPLSLRLAEQLKIQLSSQEQATEVFFDDETLESYELQLDRAQFEQILRTQGFFEGLDRCLTGVLQQARRQGLEKEDIAAVLLVGGTAQVPAVQRWVETHFPADKIRRDKPFEAIAQGALQLDQGIELKDFLYHGYGIRYWDKRNNCHSWHPIIAKGQTYPMSQPIELRLGASLENQPSIELILGELGESQSQTEIYFEGNRLVTKRSQGDATVTVQPLNDRDGARTMASLMPLGMPGCDRIKLAFTIDQNRFLRLTVEDLLIGETLMTDQAVIQMR